MPISIEIPRSFLFRSMPMCGAQVSSEDDALLPSGMLRTMVGATALVTGQDVGVAIVDSGIFNRPDLHDQLQASYDFTVDGTPKPGSRRTSTVTAPISRRRSAVPERKTA